MIAAKGMTTFQKRRTDKRSSPVAPNPVGRPVGRSSDDTRGSILDAAEALFAEGGYDGTSIRDIAQRANVQAAVIGYHFGTKADVFDAVVERRGAVLNATRRDLLVAAKTGRRGKPIPLETLIRDYVSPFLEMTSHGDPGWRNFAALMGRLANSPRGTELVADHFDAIATLYLEEFHRTLPTMPEGRLVDAFLYMVSAMLFVCADTQRWERLTHKSTPRPRDAEAILKDLLPFVAGGFRALMGGPK
jgi:AcrR family transcriptional regulator